MEFVCWVSLGIICYTGIVYPFLMWLACRWRHRRVGELGELPHVSMIVAACNEEVVIRDKIENALHLEYPQDRLEIIIASDGSTDGTVEIARQYEGRGVKVLDLSRNIGKAGALNEAAPVCSGSILCLSDANVMLRPDALARQLQHFADDNVGAVTGDVRLESEQSDFGAGESLYYKLERALQRGESQFGSVMAVDGGMYLIRRELFLPLPGDTILDDFVTSMNVIRQGKRIVYEQEAIATENGTPNWRDEFRRRVRVMTGAVQSIKRRHWPPLTRPVELWQYLSHKLLRWAQPIWLLLLFIASAALSAEGPVYRVLLAGQVAFYGAAALAAASPAFRGTRLGGVPFYFAISHIAMLVGLINGSVTRPSGIWKRTPRTSSDSCPENVAEGTRIGAVR